MSAFEGLYSADIQGGPGFENFFDGVTLIQVDTAYKTFEIPVYDGLGKLTTDKVSVTVGDNEGLIPDGKTEALKGVYKLVYDKDSSTQKVSAAFTNKADLWNAIKNVADTYDEFDVSKAKLVRYVRYDAVIGYFTSVDLLNEVADNRDINYLNERKTSGSIWKISCSEIGPAGYYIYPNKFVYGDSFDAEIKEFLNEHDCDTVSLRNKTELHITATDPSTQANPYGGFKLEITEDVKQYITIDTDKQYPVKVSDLAAKLTAEIRPTAGMKYNKDEWELWPCYTSTGNITMDSKATVADPTEDIGITHYELALEQHRGDLLVYFKQVAIAPAVTVTAPAFNAVPANTATIPANDGYSVESVKWFDGTTPLDAGDKFDCEKQYTVKVTLRADRGLSFTDDTVAKINGETITDKTIDDGVVLTLSYTFPAIEKNAVPAVELTVDAPVLGGTPDVTADVAAGANYTASAVTWSPADAPFKGAKQYTAAVKLTAKDGYKFTATTTAKVNGNTVTPVLNTDGTLTVSYTFDELSPWDNVDNELKSDNPTFIVPKDSPTIPKSVLDKILNGTKPVIIKFEPDNGISWEILPGGTAPDGGIDLSVIKDNSEWATVVNNITGETIKMQISISHNGPFGFTANLVVDLTQLMQSDKIDQNGTYYANLYLVPDKDNRDIEPEWKGSDELTKQNGKWIAKLEFNHASDWLITIDDKDKDPSKNNNNGGSGSSGSSGSGSFRPSGSSTTTESSTPMFGGKAMSWSDIVAELKKLPIGSEVTIELNGITNVPFEVINVIGERKLKTTFKFDSVRSWKLNGAEITAPATADLSIIAINRLKTDSLRGISGYQFTMNDTNIPTGIEIAFKTEYAGQFANLYKVVDGKLTFVTCAKVGADGKVILPDIAEKGDYVAMLSELSDVLGDMNNDGVLDQKDASAILKDIVGLEQGKNPLMADFNGDGAIDQKDASAILKSIVGLE